MYKNFSNIKLIDNINYCIINVTEDRLDNVNAITAVVTGKRHFPVFYYKNNKKQLFNQFSKFKKKLYGSKPLNIFISKRKEGEIYCWFSHMSSWDYIIDNNLSSMLIFEDDVLIDKIKYKKILLIIKISDKDLIIFSGGARCYYLTNNGAKILKKYALEGFKNYPVDEFMLNLKYINRQDGPQFIDYNHNLPSIIET